MGGSGRSSWGVLPAVVAALVLPAGAQATAVSTDMACYRAGQEGEVTVTGFRPGATVDAVVEGQPMVNLMPASDGSATAPFTPLASPASGDVDETLVATDDSTSPVLTAQTTYRVTATTVKMVPSAAKLSQTVTWRLAGFMPGTAWLHVARRNARGRSVTVRSLRLGTLAGPCGSLSVRTRQLPLAKPQRGTTYELRFSATRRTTATALVRRIVRTAR
jgi:hypothetical protein